MLTGTSSKVKGLVLQMSEWKPKSIQDLPVEWVRQRAIVDPDVYRLIEIERETGVSQLGNLRELTKEELKTIEDKR